MIQKYYFPVLPKKQTLDFAADKTPVILHGFALWGRWTLERLKAHGYVVAAIQDGNPAIQGTVVDGLRIQPPEENKETSLPVVVCSEQYQDEITAQLQGLGVKKILPYYFFCSGKELTYEEASKLFIKGHDIEAESKFKKLEREGKLYLKSLDIVITEKCSLRCRDCCNLMQYFLNPHDTDLAQLKEQMTYIFQAVSYIDQLRVLGGEPFVTPRFSQYIELLKAFSGKYGSIIVYTNGTILPQGDTLTCLKDKHIFVNISSYSGVSKKVEELAALFQRENIFCQLSQMEYWQDCGFIKEHQRTSQQLQELYDNCCVKHVFSLKDGSIYGCPFAGNAAALGAVPKNVTEAVSVLQGTEGIRTGLQNLLAKKYLKACQYCNGRSLTDVSIPAARQAAQPLPYFHYEDI